MSAAHTDIKVLPDVGALADAVAEHIVTAAHDAIHARGQFVIALSGSSTPRATYERLASPRLASRVAWSRVQIVWGDERCVPPDDADSNYRMAREALLDRVPVPASNVHRIRAEDDPEAAAADYESTLRALLRTPVGPPRASPGACIDLVMLGLGPDGHTASLFPRSAALRESLRWVIATRSSAPPVLRVSLTARVFNAAADVLFLVSGSAKAAILRAVLEGPPAPEELPAQAIEPSNGRICWFVDTAAASALGTRIGTTSVGGPRP